MTRFRVLAAAIALLALAAYVIVGLSRITLDVDITRLLPHNLKETEGYRLLLKNFSRSDELIVALQGGSAEAVEAAAAQLAEKLEARPDLASRVRWRAPWESTSAPMSDWIAWAIINQPPEKLVEIERKLAPAQIDRSLADAVERLASSLTGEEHLMGYDPLGLTEGLLAQAKKLNPEASEFVAPHGRFRVLYVRAASRPANYREIAAWMGKVRAVADEVAAPHGVRVRFTGEPAFVSEISQGMERDMKWSAISTLLLTGLIIWLSFRTFRIVPLVIAMIGLVFVLTLATSGILLGSLTVLTVGFGAILIGLSADYGVLVYQAMRNAPAIGPLDLRRTRRGILWAAATTAASFLSLVPSGMPGLAELGLLVAIGVIIGAVVFLVLFPRVLAGLGRLAENSIAGPPRWLDRKIFGAPAAWAVVICVMFCALGVVIRGAPRIDADAGSLRPRVSEAYETFEAFATEIGGGTGVLSVLVTGNDAAEVAGRLDTLQTALEREQAAGHIRRFALPTLVWPRPDYQQENLAGAARRLAADLPRLQAALTRAGFNETASELASKVMAQWEQWNQAEVAYPIMPTSDAARELLRRFVRIAPVSENNEASNAPSPSCLALGFVTPSIDAAVNDMEKLQNEGIYFAGRRLLNRALEEFMGGNFLRLAVIFGGLTFFLLAIALRHWRPLVLTMLSLGLGFSGLVGAMSWLGLSWNAFTLPAVLLSFGTGSDYFIYVILDLEKRGDDLPAMRAELGQGVLVCACTAVIGFGSLSQAATTGLANLGIVCALALVFNVLVAVLVMPHAWRWMGGGGGSQPPVDD